MCLPLTITHWRARTSKIIATYAQFNYIHLHTDIYMCAVRCAQAAEHIVRNHNSVWSLYVATQTNSVLIFHIRFGSFFRVLFHFQFKLDSIGFNLLWLTYQTIETTQHNTTHTHIHVKGNIYWSESFQGFICNSKKKEEKFDKLHFHDKPNFY